MDDRDPEGPASKRRKLDPSGSISTSESKPEKQVSRETALRGLSRPISPPIVKRKKPLSSPSSLKAHSPTINADGKSGHLGNEDTRSKQTVPSPVQLTRIHDLSPADNVDTVGLEDILGDPLIKECWNFNFLFDLDFVMTKFDPDVRNLVLLKVVHGFWRNDDDRKTNLQERAERYPNIKLISAYMPDPFGTHHSKMLILFRHDNTAQIVIHTANMISKDWMNMTQAIWRSPLLPLRDSHASAPASQAEPETYPVGSGERFRIDLSRYLNAYGKLKDLTRELTKYDFSAIRAAFIGSAPSRQKPTATAPGKHTSWGWLGLGEILSTIPSHWNGDAMSTPNIIVQISSIATLGQATTWLDNLQTILSHSSESATISAPVSKHANFFKKQTPKAKVNVPPPTINIIFPTADEVRTSLDGYASGGSIHTKIQSAAQQKQLQYLRPLFCHWKHQDTPSSSSDRRKAFRGSAAPHIKTYIRFNDETQTSIDWAMITSANLSKQAWGEVQNKQGEIRIQSWECGVVVWPDLFRHNDEKVKMVPVFGKDMPVGEEQSEEGGNTKVVGFRMPYDLPLSPYKADEEPWCASSTYSEPDWKGVVWQ